MDRERFEQAILKAIADRDVQSPEDRLRVYNAARSALSRKANAGSAPSEALEAAIRGVEWSFAPKPVPEAAAVAGIGSQGTSARLPFPRLALPRSLPAFVGGALLGAAFMALGFVATSDSAGQPAAATERLEAKYANSLRLLPAAEDFLEKVSGVVLDMQKKDGVALEARAGKRFMPLKAFDASLAGQMPATLPPGTTLMLRANRKDFKILLNWTLCGAASIARPELVDPVRNKTDTLTCPYFGIWTQGATNW